MTTLATTFVLMIIRLVIFLSPHVQAHHLDPVLHQAAHEVLFKLALKVQMTVRPENKC